ncbi:MAG: hypothetical protein O3A63_15830 [Proteobacteria bacterium]|nr:hypothetical protein [Pseudomonadota bacterium]
MNERIRPRPIKPEAAAPEGDAGNNSDAMRDLADRLMANTEESLRRLGLANANEFLNATRQSGGQ